MRMFVILFLFINLLAKDSIYIVNEKVALPKIVVKNNSKSIDTKIQKQFYDMIINDLKLSSNFEILNEEKNSNYIVEYTLKQRNQGLILEIQAKLDKNIKFDQKYTLNNIKQYPFLAHKSIKDLISALGLLPVEWLDHKILIAKNNGPRNTQIIIADYTLTYQKIIINDGINLFPKWANKEQSAFYYSSYDDLPTLYKIDLKTMQKTKILSSPGIITASDISQDENQILLSMAPNDQADIYIYDIKNNKLQKISQYSGIDVNANFIDNDKKIVFVSDRLGYPTIFTQDLATNIVQRAVFHNRNNSSVSSWGDYFIFSSRENDNKNNFNIYLMSIKENFITQLTASGKNIFPKFSNDGGSIVFIKDINNQSSLGIIRVNALKSFYYPLKIGKIQAVDW